MSSSINVRFYRAIKARDFNDVMRLAYNGAQVDFNSRALDLFAAYGNGNQISYFLQRFRFDLTANNYSVFKYAIKKDNLATFHCLANFIKKQQKPLDRGYMYAIAYQNQAKACLEHMEKCDSHYMLELSTEEFLTIVQTVPCSDKRRHLIQEHAPFFAYDEGKLAKIIKLALECGYDPSFLYKDKKPAFISHKKQVEIATTAGKYDCRPLLKECLNCILHYKVPPTEMISHLCRHNNVEALEQVCVQLCHHCNPHLHNSLGLHELICQKARKYCAQDILKSPLFQSLMAKEETRS